ncbi:MAG: SGNH/GDSL hydrolase family protein [Kiritimatiellaeota bacterium]|nr:SGNH/GDSL hydrolase family protein [Kiritimatiellota bacterium]
MDGNAPLLCLALGPLALAAGSASGAQPGKRPAALELTLPPAVYAVSGIRTQVFFDNVVLTPNPEAHRFQVRCNIGNSEPRSWSVTPRPVDVGDHPFEVIVSDGKGRELGRARAVLKVSPSDAGAGRRLRLLMVGDSLTHATVYPNELARLLEGAGNPALEMLGTHRPKNARVGVAHEGYGGWTWQRFLEQYEPNPDGTYRKRSSPFVYLGADGRPGLDLPRYFRENCGGVPPDLTTFLLGINDCFTVDPDDPAAIDRRIDIVLGRADALLAAFRAAAPTCALAVCLTPPPNARESGFEANYHGKYHRWGWKRIQHRLVQRTIDRFGGREKDGIFLVPTELGIDPVAGFPENNGVHPNAHGYRQIAKSLYCWIKWWLSPFARQGSGGNASVTGGGGLRTQPMAACPLSSAGAGSP